MAWNLETGSDFPYSWIILRTSPGELPSEDLKEASEIFSPLASRTPRAP